MRILMWFSMGFALFCGVCAYGMNYEWLLPVAVLFLVVSVAAIGFTGKRCLIRPMIAILAGGLTGLAWFGIYHFQYIHPVRVLDGEEISLTITASDYSYETNYGIGTDAVAVIGGKTYRIQTYLNEKAELVPGDVIEGIFRIRLTTSHQDNPSTYYQGRGIFLFAHQTGDVTVDSAEEIPAWCFPAVLRHKIIHILESVFEADVAPFAKALLIGDSRDLDYETETALKISGIRHIVSVSGLHISILYGLICVVTLRRRYLTAVLGMPALLLFAAVAGFTPSVVRACIMVCLMMIAMLFDREYDPPTALAFAVLVMLMVNPMAVTSVSLQLSVGCVAGIFLFSSSINGWMKRKLRVKKGITSRLWNLFCSSSSVTLSAITLVTPLSACYFGTVSLISVLSNILTLWVVNLIFNGLTVVCLVYLLSPGTAGILASVLSWPVRYVLGTAKLLASFPLAAVYTKSVYIVFWLVFVYMLLAAFLLMKRTQTGVLLCCGTIGLCVALLVSWVEPLTANTRVTMLDVGQGQAILLQSEGKAFLVDCGGDSDETTADLIAETLLSQGVRTLDGVILTHYDRDHSGALHHLLTRINTEHLFLPDTRNNFEEPLTDGKIFYIWEDLELAFGEAKLQIYGPVYSGFDNENSLCVLFDTQKCDILITGDRSAFGERMLLRRRLLPDVDILVAGHHGAADSTSEALLRAVKPETVLISVEQDNPYGHPAPALIQRLAEFGCAVYRTDLNGTIVIRR